MKILITGIAGFAGSTLGKELKKRYSDISIIGIDNFSRPGSEQNRHVLKDLGINIIHGDLRNQSDLETMPTVDAVIDAAANPSVLAGTGGKTSSLQLIEHNIGSTINLLEYCKRTKAGFILLSTSRVYSIDTINAIEMETLDDALCPLPSQTFPRGSSAKGISENFSTETPISLYGVTKLASESLALEYGHQFGFPVWINRCGVLAGAGQFGRSDQGIFTYWINAYLRKAPMKYIGYGGTGHQVRDCLHPKDLVSVILRQLEAQDHTPDRICNFGGGIENTFSLSQLSDWCADRCGSRQIDSEPETRSSDVPWMVMDNTKAGKIWGWAPSTPINDILEEILEHAQANPAWLELSMD